MTGVQTCALPILILVDALSIRGLLLTQHGEHQEAHKKLNEAWNLACERKLRATLPLLGLELGRIDVMNGNIERRNHDRVGAARGGIVPAFTKGRGAVRIDGGDSPIAR